MRNVNGKSCSRVNRWKESEGKERILEPYFLSKFSSQIGRILEESEGKENFSFIFFFLLTQKLKIFHSFPSNSGTRNKEIFSSPLFLSVNVYLPFPLLNLQKTQEQDVIEAMGSGI